MSVELWKDRVRQEPNHTFPLCSIRTIDFYPKSYKDTLDDINK